MALYNKQLEQEKQEDDAIDPEDLTEAKMLSIMNTMGLNSAEEQVKLFAQQIEERAAEGRKCGQHSCAGLSFSDHIFASLFSSGLGGQDEVPTSSYGFVDR